MYTEVEEFLKAKKTFRVQVTPKQSREVQKLCFKYGVLWEGNRKIIQFTMLDWLFIGKFIVGGYYDHYMYKGYHKIELKEKDTAMQVNTVMVKEKIIGLINAFDTGVEFEVGYKGNWTTLKKDIDIKEFMSYLRDYEVRIKVKPEYVPWNTIEEVIPHMSKVFVSKKGSSYVGVITYAEGNTREGLIIQGWTAKKFFENNEFLDGTPCGKLKQ